MRWVEWDDLTKVVASVKMIEDHIAGERNHPIKLSAS